MSIKTVLEADIGADAAEVILWVAGASIAVLAIYMVVEYLQAVETETEDELSAEFQQFLSNLNPFS